MKIAIIGIGNVGGTLGPAWAKAGHEVIYGVRDPNSEKVKTLLNISQGNAQAVSVAEAAAGADIIVFATPWSATQEAVAAAGNLSGKLVVDCTNPIAPDLKGLSIGTTTSAGEQVAQWAEGATVVKAFNTTGSGNMVDPRYGSQSVTMFICGNDPEARETVAQLAKDMGFEPCITGPLYHARYFEPMAMLWVDMAYLQGRGPEFAYKIISR
jgi:predicted dinucleotide-binding enzyme